MLEERERERDNEKETNKERNYKKETKRDRERKEIFFNSDDNNFKIIFLELTTQSLTNKKAGK